MDIEKGDWFVVVRPLRGFRIGQRLRCKLAYDFVIQGECPGESGYFTHRRVRKIYNKEFMNYETKS